MWFGFRVNCNEKFLKDHELITKKIYPVVPPKVEYTLTDLGKTVIPVIALLDLTIGMLSFAPGIGWIIGGSYFIADIISKSATGNSLVENITGEKYD